MRTASSRGAGFRPRYPRPQVAPRAVELTAEEKLVIAIGKRPRRCVTYRSMPHGEGQVVGVRVFSPSHVCSECGAVYHCGRQPRLGLQVYARPGAGPGDEPAA